MIICRKITSKKSIIIENDFSNGDIVEVNYSVVPDSINSGLDIFWVSLKNLSEKKIPESQRISSQESVHVVTEDARHIYVKNNNDIDCKVQIDLRVSPIPPFFYLPSVSATSGF